MKKLIYLNFLLLLCSFASAQVLDDSTKNIYGAHSTKYITEQDVLENNINLDPRNEKSINSWKKVDTTINNFHNYNYLNQGHELFQNLGNYGTAISPVYYSAPSGIGRRSGFSVYDVYAFDPSSIKYYNPRSPFSQVTYVQGSRGQQSIDAEFARNIKRNWNIGFDLNKSSSKRITGFPTRNEPQMKNTSLALFTRYFSWNKRYQLLANYTMMNHACYEDGGLLLSKGDNMSNLFRYGFDTVRLSKANSAERRYNYHIYQEYAVDTLKRLELWSQLDYQYRVNKYIDDTLRYNRSYYTTSWYDTSHTTEQNIYSQWDVKAGVKGTIGRLYYRLYGRYRHIAFRQHYFTDKRIYYESFTGGQAYYQLRDSTRIDFAAEYLIGKDYMISGGFKNQRFRLSYKRMSYSPSLIQRAYFGNNFFWGYNNFNNTVSDLVSFSIKLKKGALSAQPFLSFNNVSNYIYYNENVTPVQSAAAVQIYTAGMDFSFRAGIFNLENMIRYTYTGGADVIRVPALYDNMRIYLQSHIFKKAAYLQVGVDVYARSAYTANSYMPVLQQFYLSDKSNSFNNLNPYVMGDVFLNMGIKQFSLFLKYSYVNQGIPYKGYFMTPYYSAMPRSLDFGINWKFYD